MKDLSKVFRDPTDRGEERLVDTPSPSILSAQLETFLRKWEKVEYSGWRVLSPSAVKEAQNLKKHMLKGCLSGIKPGRGTNRNEALHKQLNKIVGSSRYGLELAFALFSTIFFQHNEKISAKKEKRRERVIIEYDELKHHPNNGEYFGLQWLSDSSTTVSSYNQEPLTLYRSSYSDFVQRITNGDKVHTVVNDVESLNEQDECLSSDEEENIIPLAA